jgi:hypothetical protein
MKSGNTAHKDLVAQKTEKYGYVSTLLKRFSEIYVMKT